MQTCFQHGLGSKQFSNALRVQHLQLHNVLDLQYLHHIAPQKDLSVWQGKTFKLFLAFDDDTEDGFHGFTPNAQWLRDVYDHFIEHYQNDFNQYTAMLTGNVCTIDHSFKVCTKLKHAPKALANIVSLS